MNTKEESFTKEAPSNRVDMRCEASGLRWLAEAEAQGGIRITHVISADQQKLTEERIATGKPSSYAARRIGAALALTHAAGARWFGCPPDGWDFNWGQGYVIANSLTPVITRQQAPTNWGSYYADFLIMSYARQAFDQGVFDKSALQLIERIASRLRDGIFDADEPALVEKTISRSKGALVCARLHGDLWAGNVLWSAEKNSATGGVLIDPMAHGGHAESDLAMLRLFGFSYLDDVIDGYNEISPLSSGWRERIGLHQLAPLLHHCVLYGESYVASALSTASRYL